MASNKSTPKDSQVMTSILKEIGINDYEPRVLNQMLEFTYRYVTNILDDAQLFSSHAKKKSIDVDDVKLAIDLQTAKYFTTPPPREFLAEIARQKNSIPLPVVKPSAGPKLPPDRYSLTASNYRLKSNAKKQKTFSVSSRLNLANIQANHSLSKLNPGLSLNNKAGPSLSVMTKSGQPSTVTVMPRTIASALQKPPTPIIKLSEGGGLNANSPLLQSTSSMSSVSHIVMPTTVIKSELPMMSDNSLKRKREDDMDNYDI